MSKFDYDEYDPQKAKEISTLIKKGKLKVDYNTQDNNKNETNSGIQRIRKS